MSSCTNSHKGVSSKRCHRQLNSTDDLEDTEPNLFDCSKLLGLAEAFDACLEVFA
jgi:hypothetical protein